MIFLLSIFLYLISIILVYGILIEKRYDWILANMILSEPYTWIYILTWPVTFILYPILCFLFGLVDILIDWIEERQKNKKNE